MSEPVPAFLNPAAGSATAAARALEADPRFTLRRVAGAHLAEEIRRDLAGGARRILVAGGDGTLATAAGALLDSSAELALLPAGTLNHFARSLGVPADPREALDVAAGSGTRRVDVGMVNGHPFLNTSSLGAYVALVRRRERLRPRLGYLASGAVATAAVLLRLPRFSLALEVDGHEETYRTPLLFVGVGERDLALPGFGRRVDEGSGVLHAVVVPGGGRARLLALAMATAASRTWRLARMPQVDSFLVRRCRVDLPRRAAHVALDGELVALRSPLRYRILPGALTVVAPERPDEGR